MMYKIAFTCLFLINCICFCQTIEDIDKKADSLYYQQDDYYTKDDFKAEIALRKKVLQHFKDTTSKNHKSALAKKYASQASYLMNEMKYKEAIELSNKALDIYKNINNQNLVFKGVLYKKLYYPLNALKKYKKTDEIILKALHTLKDTLGNIHPFIADVEFDLGAYTYNRLGNTDKVIEQYKKSINISIAALGENNTRAAIQEHHLALIYGFIGYYKKELESYKNVIKRWEALKDYPDKSYLSIAYGSLATWYKQHGDLETAEMYLHKKLNLVKKYSVDVANWFNETYRGRSQNEAWDQIATFSLLKKDTAQALYYNDKIKDYFVNYDFDDPKNNPHNLPYSKSWAQHVKVNRKRFDARLYEKRSPQKSIKLYEELLNDRKKTNYNSSSFDIINPLHKLYIKQKKYKLAHDLLKYALKEQNTKAFDVKHYYAAQANIFFLEGNFKEMRCKYQNAFNEILKEKNIDVSLKNISYQDCKPFGDNAIVDITLIAADNFYKTYKKTDNKNDLKVAQSLNKLASTMFSENFTHIIYNNKSYEKATTIYEQLLTTSIKQTKPDLIEKLLEQIENMNSKIHWKKFLHSQMRKNLNVPDSILNKENELQAKLHFYKKSLFTSKELSSEKELLFKEKINTAESEFKQLHKWYTNNYPAYARQSQKSFKLNSIKRVLKQHQKLIRFIVAKDNVYAFTITHDNLSFYKVGKKRVIIDTSKKLINALKEFNNDDYIEFAKHTYEILLPDEILNSNENSELIFVLDDVLRYIPMEALIDKKGDFLIKNYKVSYASSLLLFNEQIKVKRIKKNKLGVFAPIYRKKTFINPKRDDSNELLGANKEALSIAKLFNAGRFIGNEANKNTFIEKAKNFGVLHLAMHSTINNTKPELSNLNFSPDSKDNKLFVSELYSIPLSANLAVLSACNTGTGELKNGEGILNISRAFTYAGVPSTIASLWAVPDKETSTIMMSFYRYLKNGKQKNEALQLAKLDYLNTTDDALLKHPYFWAGFTLNGNISGVEFEGKNQIWHYSLFIIIALLLIYFFRKYLLKRFK